MWRDQRPQWSECRAGDTNGEWVSPMEPMVSPCIIINVIANSHLKSLILIAGSLEKDEAFKENGYIEVKSSILMPTINRHNSTSALYKPHSISRDTQSLIGSSLQYHNSSEKYKSLFIYY